MKETKTCELKIEAVNEDGTFSGYLSVYDIVDLGKDVVEKGAFTKTIRENKGIVPLLINHNVDSPAGMLALSDDEHGLKVDGEMYINESPKAKEWHGLTKRFFERGRPMGLSIGYEKVKAKVEKGIRYLQEIKLYEGSLTPFPMNTAAFVTGVKTDGDIKSDFAEELANAQLWAMHCMMMDALDCALCDIRWMAEGNAADRTQQASDSIEQFRKEYLAYLPGYFELTGVKKIPDPQSKIGRTVSAAKRTHIEGAIAAAQDITSKLQALLVEDAAGTAEETAAALTPDPKAVVIPATEPETIHSMVESFSQQLKTLLAA